MPRGWLHAIVGSSRSPMRDREEARPVDSLVVMALRQFDFASLAASASAADRACRSCEAHERRVEATSSDASVAAQCPLGPRWKRMPGVHGSSEIPCGVDSPPLLLCCLPGGRGARGGQEGRFAQTSWNRCRIQMAFLWCVFCRQGGVSWLLRRCTV